jgi:hypothetical protein
VADALRGGLARADWLPPASLPDTIGNHRWFKFYEQVNDHSENAVIRLYWGRYICRYDDALLRRRRELLWVS